MALERAAIDISLSVALREVRLMHAEQAERYENRIFVLAQQLESASAANKALADEMAALKAAAPPAEGVN
jgi:hypothetical protein